MDRNSAPPRKKKRKDSQSSCKESSSSKKPPPPKEPDDKQPTVNGKSYAYISPDTISKIAESAGIPGLSEEIAINLAEDASYKLQEIISASCTIMRSCKRRKLLTSDVSSALQLSDAPAVLGHAGDEEQNFHYVPEADVYVGEDIEVDLTSVALSIDPFLQSKPSYIASSWPVMENVQRSESIKHSSKSDERGVFAVPYPKNATVNGDLKQESSVLVNKSHSLSKTPPSSSESSKHSLKSNSEFSKSNRKGSPSPASFGTAQKHSSSKTNGRLSCSLNNAQDIPDSRTLQRNLEMVEQTEEEMYLSTSQFTYFNVVANCILQGPDLHFQQALLDLRSNEKLGMVVAPLLNLVAHTVVHVPRHFGLLQRLLDIVDALLHNHHVNPCYSIALNRVVNALLAVTSDRRMVVQEDDFLLRRRAAHLLAKVLAEWNVEENHVSELLSRVALLLGDANEPTQSQYGVLVIFQALGQTVLHQCLLPVLHLYLPLFEKQQSQPNCPKVHLQEIRGVILDIAEFLHGSDSESCNSFNISSVQARDFDNMLYQHFGDSVCARRRLRRVTSDRCGDLHIGQCSNTTDHKLPKSNLSGIRFQGTSVGSRERSFMIKGVFEETKCMPLSQRKDIHFRFAGANPVPKERLKRRGFDQAHATFLPQTHGPLHSLYQRLCSMVGRRYRNKSDARTKSCTMYNLLATL